MEAAQVLVGGFLWPAGEEDRWPDPPAFELALVPEGEPGRVAMTTAAARSLSRGMVAAARGSSWFSRNRASPRW